MVPVFAGIQEILTMSEKGEGQLGDGGLLFDILAKLRKDGDFLPYFIVGSDPHHWLVD